MGSKHNNTMLKNKPHLTTFIERLHSMRDYIPMRVSWSRYEPLSWYLYVSRNFQQSLPDCKYKYTFSFQFFLNVTRSLHGQFKLFSASNSRTTSLLLEVISSSLYCAAFSSMWEIRYYLAVQPSFLCNIRTFSYLLIPCLFSRRHISLFQCLFGFPCHLFRRLLLNYSDSWTSSYYCFRRPQYIAQIVGCLFCLQPCILSFYI